ncbi:MAG: hypothetical protein K2G29_03095 [Muribaculaceae bacterium]|nr:hypothetical protein [Muribaculaceae bacterium]MDE6422680.1 hypothetical protein [Muribaculaceae bacterium]
MFGSSKKKKNDNDNNKKSKKSHATTWISDVRYGRSLSVEFFKRNAWLLMIIVVSMLALMGLRYKTKTKMEEIKRLTTELQIAESSKLQEKAAYMSLIRETEMRRLVEENGLGLEFQEQPPFELILEKD